MKYFWRAFWFLNSHHPNTTIMKKFVLTFVAILAFAISGFCSITIAVLPYQVTYRGNIPQKLTDEKLAEMQTQDSEKYQSEMIKYLTSQAKRRKYEELDIHVIGQVQIDAMLRAKGIDTVAWSMTDKEIADAIGVTHVLRGSMTKNFIMSDAAAVGLNTVGVLTGNGSTRVVTSTISVTHSVRDAFVGASVFSRQWVRTTTAMRPDQRAIRDTFRKASRKMMRAIKNDD